MTNTNKLIKEKISDIVGRFRPWSDREQEEATEALTQLFNEVAMEVVAELPKVSRTTKVGKDRAFVTGKAMEYADIYMAGERNYRSKSKRLMLAKLKSMLGEI